MARAVFRVAGRLDGAPGGTVVVDRDRALISVRPLKRRRTYELPLIDVAVMVLQRVVLAERPEPVKRQRGKRLRRRAA